MSTDYPGTPLSAGGASPKSAVKALQTALNEIGGVGVEGAPSLKVDGVFGPTTEDAVKLFQAQGFDLMSRPLEIDGVVGALTWHALFGGDLAVAPAPASGGLAEAAIRIARKEATDKVCEVPLGSNRGPRVEEYLRGCGLGGGNAWCAAFVHWCFAQAVKEIDAANPPPNPAPRTGGVHEMWRRAGKAGLLRYTPSQARENPALVKPGQLFFLDSGGGYGHVGLIADVRGAYLVTIEGNTTRATGSREGNGVFERDQRKIAQVNVGFADFTRKLTDQP